MNNQTPAEKLEAIEAAIFRGEKIAAIKLYRTAMGGELMDAKNAIERLEAELRAKSPEKFTAAGSRKGCLGVVVGVCAVVVMAVVWFFNR